MKLSDFEYTLPKERIAQFPVEPRSSSKLMVLNGMSIEHTRFSKLVNYLREDDVLVLNDSKVIPARLIGKKKTGGRAECLVVEINGNEGLCLIKGKKIRPNTEIIFQKGLMGKIVEKKEGKYRIVFSGTHSLKELIEKFGRAPLPPYIKNEVELERYQTVYASNPGSIAAPTAGFHFTRELLEEIEKMGVNIAHITLHVGLSTFTPVKTNDIAKHVMEPEYFLIDEPNAEIINSGKRIIACGTTAVKALESSTNEKGKIKPSSGWSDLFIYPTYIFKSRIDCLITNFHLPKSTLLLLVCAYAGTERILNAYQIAIKEGYRFYSFGDCMFINGE